MGVRNLKPVTPGSRFASRSDFSEITTNKPEKSLTVALRKKGGRNNTGRITVRRRGGGHKRRYRIIDYKRDKFGINGKVATIEYDPNRSAYISLIHYDDGEKRYILSPLDISVGTNIVSGDKVPLKIGNALLLSNIPKCVSSIKDLTSIFLLDITWLIFVLVSVLAIKSLIPTLYPFIFINSVTIFCKSSINFCELREP